LTERKPTEMTFASWIDQQISEAEQRGAFDNLPGAGQPLPAAREADAGQAWLRDYLRREGVSTEELLPTPLRLRKEVERLPDTLRSARSERQAREMVADLNQRIAQWRRIPVGPPVFVPLVDEELAISTWREERPVTSGVSVPGSGVRAAQPETRRSRWWHRPGLPWRR
jgi:hypothetical protein